MTIHRTTVLAAAFTLGAAANLLASDNAITTFTRSFENIGALVFQLDAGRWGFSAEVAGGTGFGTKSDVGGVTAMPYYNLTKQLQLVFRYNYLASQDPRGVRSRVTTPLSAASVATNITSSTAA